MKGNGKPPIPKSKNKLKPSPSAINLPKTAHLSAPGGDGNGGDQGSSNVGEVECGGEERVPLNPATATATSSTAHQHQQRGQHQQQQHQQPQAIPPWKPMAHSCAQCSTKTTAEKFKRTCLGNHEFVCRRYHPSLLRRGRIDDCLACRNEDEQHARRAKELARAKEELKAFEAVDLEGCAKSNSTLQKQRREVQRLEQESEDIKTRTRAATEVRKLGFMLWKS